MTASFSTDDFLASRNISSLNELSSLGNNMKTVAAEEKPAEQGRLSYEQQKEAQKKLRRLEKQVDECEKIVADIEQQIADIEARLSTADGASDATLYERHGELKRRLDKAVDEWEAASVALDEARDGR